MRVEDFPRPSAPPAQTIGQDRRLSVRVQVCQRVRQGLPHDPAAVGPDPVLTQGQAGPLERQQLLLGAVKGDLLLVPLPATPLSGDLELALFIDKSLCRLRTRPRWLWRCRLMT